MQKTIKVALILGVISFILWRNYGVIPKGDKLDLSNIKTNEQKELYQLVKSMTPKEGETVSTSFGVYEYKDNSWIKVKEIWD